MERCVSPPWGGVFNRTMWAQQAAQVEGIGRTYARTLTPADFSVYGGETIKYGAPGDWKSLCISEPQPHVRNLKNSKAVDPTNELGPSGLTGMLSGMSTSPNPSLARRGKLLSGT